MRRQNDRYFTPEFATQELCKRVEIADRVLECCAGDEAIANVLRTVTERPVYCNDIVSSNDRVMQYDVALEQNWEYMTQSVSGVDWVVTNPPFSVAPKIVPLAFKYARVGIAMLLRLSYLEPCESVAASRRGQWLIDNKSYFSNLIVLPRISFTGDGKSDNVTCAWMVWRKDHLGAYNCTVDWVLK